MGSLFSSPAAAVGEFDYSRSSFPLEYMTRPLPKEMLAKLEYDPAGFQEFVDRASVARSPKLTQEEIDARFISRLSPCPPTLQLQQPGSRFPVRCPVSRGDEGCLRRLQGTPLVPCRLLGSPEGCRRRHGDAVLLCRATL